MSRVERGRLVRSAAAQRRLAAGIDRIAGHYRAAARQHEAGAKRLEADICASREA